MGEAFAFRALEKGHHVTVWNRTPERCRRARCGRRRPGRLARRGGGGSGRRTGRAGGRRRRARSLPGGRRCVGLARSGRGVRQRQHRCAEHRSAARRCRPGGADPRQSGDGLAGDDRRRFRELPHRRCPLGDHGRGAALDGPRLGLHALRAIRDRRNHEDRPEHAADHGRSGARRGYRHGPRQRPLRGVDQERDGRQRRREPGEQGQAWRVCSTTRTLAGSRRCSPARTFAWPSIWPVRAAFLLEAARRPKRS